ncbi:ATP-dependent RecD-like DNA helicase [bacterium MnTg02]|nr:ATP-dependent RecD-like DNA helicase [bacterium MnTg02]
MTNGDPDVEQVAANSPGSLGEFNRRIMMRKPSQEVAEGEFGPDFADEPEAQKALQAIDSGANCIFILGRAGTGKTTLVRHIMHSRGNTKQVVLAPTGIAAINVKGQTIHSFFRFPPRLLDRDNLDPSRRNRLWRHIERIIIDEVSMVRVDVMDAMDAVLRNVRKDNRPFGGVQMVFVGDFLQLPPVVPPQEAEMLLQLGYPSPYCFSAKSLAEAQPTIIHLPTVRRQTDPFFIEQLGKLRDADEIDSAVTELNKRCARPHRAGAEPMLLTGTNARANHYNQAGLDMIEDAPMEYIAQTTGTFDQHAGRLPVPETLVLKPGARVMALKNDPKGRWVNGSLGTVAELEPDRVWVQLDSNGHVVDVERQSWENIRYKWDQANKTVITEIIGSFTQMPLNLAWAATIHKAQGLSLDDVRIDLEGGAFASGQAYVAISRARSLNGLSLSRPLRPSDVFIDPLLSEFDLWTRSNISTTLSLR